MDLDISGLPCTDNSQAKQGRKFEEGETGPLFIIWALRLRRDRVPLSVLENTPVNWSAIQLSVFGFSLSCPDLV